MQVQVPVPVQESELVPASVPVSELVQVRESVPAQASEQASELE